MATEPTTLQEAILFYSDPDNCLNTMVARRWPNGVSCPTCGSTDVHFLANQRRWECKGKHSKKQFSAKVGTIFEDSPIGLDKWLTATWMLSGCKNGISSWEIHRALGVTQKTAWFMMHRIRLGMQDEQTGGKLSGGVEVDETFIGAKARNMHKDVKERKIHGRGSEGKTIVAAVLERGGKVRAKIINRRKKKDLQALVREHVEPKSALYSDALRSYDGLNEEYKHQVIDHAEAYVDGQVHTNGMENFWSLLKRGIHGTYISVEPYHLFRYVDEQAFRFNNRQDMNDADRFNAVLGQIVGKRLTDAELTGKLDATTQATN
jgi:transposase-like protein